jgi:conjugative transposon TraN protein
MKKVSAAMATVMIILLFKVQVFAQTTSPSENISVIEPYHLAVTFNKTTNLIFQYAIKSADRGSKDVLVKKAAGVENILLVKAGKKSFDETNITVITADGKLYSYMVRYTDNPSVLNICYKNSQENQEKALFSEAQPNEAEVQGDAEKVFNAVKNIKGIKDRKFGIKMQLDAVYIHNEAMYYRIKLQNHSNINYDIEQLRFFIKDQIKSKRTATQELEVYPLYIHNDTSIVTGSSDHVFVFAVEKFTIPDKKYLIIQLMEKNGGRHLELKIYNNTIVKAKLIQ